MTTLEEVRTRLLALPKCERHAVWDRVDASPKRPRDAAWLPWLVARLDAAVAAAASAPPSGCASMSDVGETADQEDDMTDTDWTPSTSDEPPRDAYRIGQRFHRDGGPPRYERLAIIADTIPNRWALLYRSRSKDGAKAAAAQIQRGRLDDNHSTPGDGEWETRWTPDGDVWVRFRPRVAELGAGT